MSEASHPDQELFDYLASRLEPSTAKAVETHLADCDECAKENRS